MADRNENVTLEELVIDTLNRNNLTSESNNCILQSFEMTSLQSVVDLGTNLRRVFLLGNAAYVSESDLDYYQSLGYVGLGMSKSILVISNSSNHIEVVQWDIAQNVSFIKYV